jgi:hypothetical protein
MTAQRNRRKATQQQYPECRNSPQHGFAAMTGCSTVALPLFGFAVFKMFSSVPLPGIITCHRRTTQRSLATVTHFKYLHPAQRQRRFRYVPVN